MSIERKLLEAIAAVRSAPRGKRVVHILSSAAKADPNFAKHMEKAEAMVAATIVGNSNGGCFALSSGDLVFVCSQVSAGGIGGLCSRLESLFFADRIPPVNSYGEKSFYKIFDAGNELAALIVAVRRMLVTSQPDQEAPPIGVKEYESITQLVKGSNIRSIIFNQPVYRVQSDKVSIEFLEFYVSMEQLRKVACPNHNIPGNAWLFNMVKKDLDSCMMRIIGDEIGEYRHKAFSINLLGDTFLSNEFADFISRISARLSGKIYVEIDRSDFLHHSHDLDRLLQRSINLNVPICVDGISLDDLRVFLPPAGAEFIKIKWSNDMDGTARARLAEAIQGLNGAKIVLSRCDSDTSLAFAKAHGIGYLQGRLVDKLFRSRKGFGAGDAAAMAAAAGG